MINSIDKLTGLYNITRFNVSLEKLLRIYPAERFCLINWNIRNMKVINNMFGYTTGNNVLVLFAENLKRTFGGKHTIYARIESDCFICCIPESLLTEDKLNSLSVLKYNSDKFEYQFYTSCGLYKIENRSDPPGLMEDKAKLALDKSKCNCQTPWVWFCDSMWESILEEQQLNIDFEAAISDKQFEIYYQPICQVKDGKIISAEALIRWNHPNKGSLTPNKFIPQFEKNGFIRILDQYVWNEICSGLKKRISEGKSIVPVCINMSRIEFYDLQYLEGLKETLLKSDVPLCYTNIEITESAYADNPQLLQSTIKKFHDIGFKVIMDDFGNGYSSLSMLKDFPIDILKIDMHFISDIDTNPKSKIILESVIQMSKRISVSVVVEGVEAQFQWDYLKDTGCDYVQGFYFHKPMAGYRFYELLEAQELADSNSNSIGSIKNVL